MTRMLLIGSHAAKHHIQLDHRWDEPKDIDVIATYEDFDLFVKGHGLKATILPNKKFLAIWNDVHMEFDMAWPGSTAESLLRIVRNSPAAPIKTLNGVEFLVAPTDWLYTLKYSHRYLKDNPFFLKTMRDVKFMRDQCDWEIADKDWLKEREKETYKAQLPRLNTSKKDFFTGDSVDYLYDHDTIHEAVKHLERPAYTYYQKDGMEVMTDRKKWDAGTQQLRLYGVLEESYVLALERSQIPHGDRISAYGSFRIALEKVCTSITSGWFRAFAYEHYDEVMDLYTDDYVTKFRKALDNGIVKPFIAPDFYSGPDLSKDFNG